MVIERIQVFLVQLDPATGAETAKTRPCVVVSPDELNRAVATVIIAPMTTVCRILADARDGNISRQIRRNCP